MSEHEISQDILIAEYEAVYYYVLSLCHNSSEAEDITQETFCRALYKKTEFKGNSSIYTWLCAIARNIWLKKIKKEKRIGVTEILLKDPLAAVDVFRPGQHGILRLKTDSF